MDPGVLRSADLNVFKKTPQPPGGVMSVVLTYLVYLLISIGLTAGVGWALARNGRTFLLDVFDGNDGLADAVNRLLVVGFYLLNLGFVTLTMRTSGNIEIARPGLHLLSANIGKSLLVLPVPHSPPLPLFA